MAELDSLEIQIEASAKQANSQLDALATRLEKIVNSLNGINTSKLANLGKNFNTVSSSTSSAAKSVGTISGRLQNMTSTLNKSTKSTRSLASAFGSFYANCFWIIRGVKAVGKAIEGSMDYVETFNYWNVTLDKIGKEFGGQFESYGYDSAESYADSFSGRLKELTTKMSGYSVGDNGELIQIDARNLSLDPEQLMSYQANISAVTNSLGLCGETSVNTSKALSMLAADMSSFKNVDLKTVMTNFQSGLIGQSRALYKYGIDITNATLQTYAYENGIEKSVSEMTQAEKMQLRLIAILDQSKVAWGDQANTINSVANQYRILKQQFSNLARIIGNLFLPILQKVLPVVNGMIIALQKLFSVLGLKLFGDNWLTGIMDGISSGSGLDDLGDSADDVASGLDDANTKAKKLRNTLLGFDQINALTDNTSGTNANSNTPGNQIDLSGAISDALAEYESVWDKALADSQNKAQEIANKIINAFEIGDYQGIGAFISNGIKNALNSIDWAGVYQSVASFGTGFAQFLNGLITPDLFSSVGQTIAGALNTAIYTSLSFATTFDWTNLGLSIASGVNTFFSTFDFAALAESINEWVQGLFTTLTTAIANIDWLTVYDGIATFLENLDIGTVGIIIGALMIKKIASLHLASKALEAIGAEISKSLAGVIGSKLGLNLAKDAGLGEVAKEIASKLAKYLGASSVTAMFAGVGSTLAGAILSGLSFADMWQEGFSWGNEILMGLGVALAGIGLVLLGVVGAIPAAIGAAIAVAVGTIVILIHDNWDAICDFFAGLAEWFDKNVITPVCDFFKGLWDKVSGFFSGLWDDISAIWDRVSGWFSEHVIEPVVGFFQGLWTRVKQIFEGLWIIIRAIWTVVSGWFNEHVIQPIVGFFKGLWEAVSGFFKDLWDDIVKIWNVVSEWFDDHVVQPVVGFFKGLWESVSGFFSDLWKDIKEVWSKVSSWFQDKVATPIKNIFDKVWSGIKHGLASAMNAVIGGVESAINWVIGGINNLIRGFNTVVQWAADLIGEDWGGVSLLNEVHFNRIDVSGYAIGGFPNTGELFVARENGITEMVGKMGNRSAVANNDQITEGFASAIRPVMRDVMMEVMMAANSQQTVAPTIDFTYKVDSETHYRATLRGKEKHDSRYHVVTEF